MWTTDRQSTSHADRPSRRRAEASMSGDIPFDSANRATQTTVRELRRFRSSGSGGGIPPGFGSGNPPAWALADQKGSTWRTWAQHFSNSAQCCSPRWRERGPGQLGDGDRRCPQAIVEAGDPSVPSAQQRSVEAVGLADVWTNSGIPGDGRKHRQSRGAAASGSRRPCLRGRSSSNPSPNRCSPRCRR